MSIQIPIPLVEYILLGPTDDRRQLQDSPILGDVWGEYAKRPGEAVDLLVTPMMTRHAGEVAQAIENALVRGVTDEARETAIIKNANIAYLQGIVVTHLTFEQVLTAVVPHTRWWHDRWLESLEDPAGDNAKPRHEVQKYIVLGREVIGDILRSARVWFDDSRIAPTERELEPLDRYVTLTGLMLWAARPETQVPTEEVQTSLGRARRIVAAAQDAIPAILDGLARVLAVVIESPKIEPLVWQVSLNRTATPALTRSIPTVKADAASALFKVSCRRIAWGVIDSGIDGSHPAFNDKDGNTRVRRCFDFTAIRQVVSLSNARPGIRTTNAATLMGRAGLLRPPKTTTEAEADLRRLAEDLQRRRPTDWELVEKFVELKVDTKPFSSHGTHVAGIIGASKEAAEAKAKADGVAPSVDCADGMCPDINLYDFRVLGPSIRDTEFAVIAALQYIRYLNERDSFFTIHGVNLSLSIPHNVRNFACGSTPICTESERLVESGVVVVAAAGNHGYKTFETLEGAYEGYAAFSITDPGNAESVITVGATHRYWPHTYGVSFFSSRGPTGDGRLKPDLVAPGERIRAPLLASRAKGSGAWGDLDGTSMAAPHVSGAAAMLLARYSELIGQPRRVKRILCESATDLGRERSFQGHGMLDVLRAFQKI